MLNLIVSVLAGSLSEMAIINKKAKNVQPKPKPKKKAKAAVDLWGATPHPVLLLPNPRPLPQPASQRHHSSRRLALRYVSVTPGAEICLNATFIRSTTIPVFRVF